MDFIFNAFRWELVWPLLYSVTRSFILESTGASITRGDATEIDIAKLAAMRSIWPEPSLWFIGVVSAASLFPLVPYLLYKNWLTYAVLQVCAIAVGGALGILIYYGRLLNIAAMRLVAPLLFFTSLFFILR